MTIPTTLGIIWIFANFMELTTYLTNLVSLIGLGIAIDYSLLMVYRFREEIRNGQERDEAIVTMMNTAGRAVVFSGTAVAIGLALLLFMPLPFMRGFGVGGLIIPTVSVIAALTFLPVLLSLVGPRLERVRLLPKRMDGSPRRPRARASGRRSPRGSCGDPWPVAIGDDGVPAPARRAGADAGARAGIERGHPEDLESVQGLDILAAAVGAGATAPTAIVIDTGTGRRRVRTRASRPPWRACSAGSKPTRRWRASTSSRTAPQHVDPSGPLSQRAGHREERLRQAREPRLRRPPARRHRARARPSRPA